MRRNFPLVLAAAAALAGLIFASFSTHDFVQHLDRQVHGLHCSFLPGLADADASGESGCHVTLMSPYSSVLRETVWGGIPISLPAMAVFAFLLAFALFVIVAQRQRDRRVLAFLIAAWCLPALASLAMGYLSIATLHAACKLCIGIYASSGVGLISAIVARVMARGDAPPEDQPDLSWAAVAAAFAGGVLFVSIPVVTYAAQAPDFGRYVGACGTLQDPSDPGRVRIAIGPQTREVPMLEVLDPLCPACRGFEARFDASSVRDQTSRRVLLFPLDDQCNWMIDHAIHPGACAISEAVLCAEGDAEEVIDWAFENQESITEAARSDPNAAARMARARFPSLAECIGSPTVRARLNQSLRWAVQNELPVLTPQVYVGDLRLCDADTDLGMDYALTRLVERYRASPPRQREEEAPRVLEVSSPPSPEARATRSESPPSAPRRAAPAAPERAPDPEPAPTAPTAEPTPPPAPAAEPEPPEPAPEPEAAPEPEPATEVTP